MPFVEFDAVVKEYRSRGGRIRALDGFSLSIEAGGIMGLLGPNGAGKSTAMSAMLGLCAIDSGSIRVLDEPVPAGLHQVIGRVGAVVETPPVLAGASVRRNVEILARTQRIPAARVTDVLERLGLADRQRQAAGGLSLGMRQRLALAVALLKQPALLVLDEPTNGLDPTGISQLRALLQGLSATGDTTIVLSSHLLGEVEAVCDRVAIVAHGRVVADGSLKQLLADSTHDGGVDVVAEDPVRAAEALTARGFAVDRTGASLRVRGTDAATVAHVLESVGVKLVSVQSHRGSLEELFLSATGAR